MAASDPKPNPPSAPQRALPIKEVREARVVAVDAALRLRGATDSGTIIATAREFEAYILETN